MRSFAGTVMSLLTYPTSSVLLDEPEAFLHPPQARRLAQVLARDVTADCQIIVATHSDAFVRALLDATEERITLARIVREGDVNKITVLDQKQLGMMWADPLIRTSDILSALFHDAAILCEGDSDARFFGMLMEATRQGNRDIDARFFHLGGKDKIPVVARALRSINIPVVAIVDIDILSDSNKFLQLFEAMGGDKSLVQKDVRELIRLVNERKGKLTGRELAIELKRLAEEVESATDVPQQSRNKLLELGKASSNWQRVKQDGFRALNAQIFARLSASCKAIGILINPEGELEGFYRTISNSRKSDWLTEVIGKDFAQDPTLEDARRFADEIRSVSRAATSR
jgi:hypothetical protein